MQTESTPSRPQRIGPYRLDGLLGVGGMGEVYRAHDERLDRWVALKQIAATGGREYHRMRQRFRREARAAARLNHPTIVQIYDVIEGDGVDWIVMELVEGETLAQRVREGPFELKALLETSRELVSGLAAAHAEGIIHRDLKAENIMLTRDGRVKILDFGLAKQLWHADSEISLSIEGTLLGTARAMAPEQALGKKADHRSDLFALGILFYELATGKSPFLGPTAVETAIRVCSHRQTPARQHNAAIPVAFSDLIDRLLEKEPARRLASVHLVAVELDDLLSQVGSLEGAGQESQDRSRQAWRGSIIEPSVDGDLGWSRGESASLYPSARSSHGASLHGEMPPGVPQPGAPQPGASQPGASQPGASQPGAAQPGAPQPVSSTAAGSLQTSSAEKAALRVQRERRQVTVLVCDLVSASSTDLGLDPELLFEVTQEFQDRARWILQRFGGHLESAPDHRLLVYFGYPRAFEDAAARAVMAAQALIADVESQLSNLVPQETEQQLTVSVGIHTGPAVVQRQDERSRIILGQTLDLASALKNRAAPGTVLVSKGTARLVEGECVLDAMPALRSRRLERPLEAFRCSLPESTRDGHWLQGEVPALLGRDQELALLQSRWQLAREGAGQVLALVAKAGYGKTRLVRALLEASQDDSAVTLLARGSLQRREEGFGVMVTLLHQLFDFKPDDDDEQQLDKIEALLDTLDAPLETMVPLLGELLSLSTRQRYPSTNPAMEPPDKTLDTLLSLLLETSRRRPLRIVVEDLQWADPSTVELLSHLMARSASFPIFTLLTYRPELSPSWGDVHALSRLTLDPLRRSTASDLITSLFPHGIRPGARQQLLERAGGVPRYVVELARFQAENASSSKVPPSLQDPLMARFDDLGSAKELARLAAVLGRNLSEDLLREVQPLDRLAFSDQLHTLLDHGVLIQRGFPGSVELSFQHSLVQETAYGSLLGRERQRLHRRVAQILDRRVASGQDVSPRLLAHHRRRAGDLELAIDHYEAAARLAESQGDPRGAIEALEKGLELLRHLPEDGARDRRELSLLITLGPLLSGARGFEDPQLEELYTRAGALCLQQDNESQLFRVLRSISAFFIARARPRRSLELVQKLLEIGQHSEDPELLLEACYAVGLTHFTLGELSAARMHLEKGIALTAGRQARPPAGDSSEDPGIACHALGALVAWHLGSVDEAVRLSDEALDAARQLGHAGTLAAALSFAAWLHQLRRDRPRVERLAEETVAISQEGGFLLWSTYGQLLLGWARLDHESVDLAAEDGVEEENHHLGLSLDVYRDAGVLFAQTYLLSLLAEAFTQRGDIDRALRHLLEALTAVEGSGERFWQAELLRLCGTMVLESTGDDSQERRREAEGYFERALDVARQQGCRSLELRAASSLARLWAERGMAPQAAQMVETLYLSFDQGLDSADLVETRQWLDQMASEETPPDAPSVTK